MSSAKGIKGLFAAGIIICLLQIWLPEYYVTGDGPCHVYNARILHDLWSGKDVDFYLRYLEFVKSPNPNWLCHIILAALMYVVNGVVAEKILLSIYVLLFCSGSYLLLRRLTGERSYWPLVLFIFVFHHPLAKGFYNFTFSIAIFFFVVLWWIRYLEEGRLARLPLFFLFTVLCFFTHPLAYAIAGMVCFFLVWSFAFTSVSAGRYKYILRQTSILVLCLIPSLLLFLKFTAGSNSGFEFDFATEKIQWILFFTHIVTMLQAEAFFAGCVGITCLVLLIIALVFAVKQKQFIHKYDGFLYTLFVVSAMYLSFPDSMLSGGLVLMRLALFIFILICCILAYRVPKPSLRSVGTVIILFSFIGLSVIRIRGMVVAGRATADYMGASRFIKPYSVVFPLYFSKNGLDERGRKIGDRNWLFTHHAGYIGVEKPAMLLDNYEANTGYFPFIWTGRAKVNPYHFLGKEPGMDADPPYAEIANYTQNGGPVVDYVLFWCFNPKLLRYERFSKLYAEINALYRPVYTSPTGRTILYERK